MKVLIIALVSGAFSLRAWTLLPQPNSCAFNLKEQKINRISDTRNFVSFEEMQLAPDAMSAPIRLQIEAAIHASEKGYRFTEVGFWVIHMRDGPPRISRMHTSAEPNFIKMSDQRVTLNEILEDISPGEIESIETFHTHPPYLGNRKGATELSKDDVSVILAVSQELHRRGIDVDVSQNAIYAGKNNPGQVSRIDLSRAAAAAARDTIAEREKSRRAILRDPLPMHGPIEIIRSGKAMVLKLSANARREKISDLNNAVVDPSRNRAADNGENKISKIAKREDFKVVESFPNSYPSPLNIAVNHILSAQGRPLRNSTSPAELNGIIAGSYPLVEPEPNALVVYYSSTGVQHVGVYAGRSPTGQYRVISKLFDNVGALYEHEIDDVPAEFGDVVRFYRLP